MYGQSWIGANPSFALDAPQDNKLLFDSPEDLTLDWTLNFIVGNANRTLDLIPTNNFALIYESASSKWRAKDVVATYPNIALIDGSRTFTGQIVSNLATGTPPLSVVSTSRVANLNADFLDGFHASAFIQSLASHSIDELSDVDTTTSAPVISEYLQWDGANWAPGAGAAARFLDLTDTPGSYATHAGKHAQVNAGATAIEFKGPWLDQDVRANASPSFAGLTAGTGSGTALTTDGNVSMDHCGVLIVSNAPGNAAVAILGSLSITSTTGLAGQVTISNSQHLRFNNSSSEIFSDVNGELTVKGLTKLIFNGPAGFDSQITSTLADGGAMPLSVASLVLCANLNADLLDGKHASSMLLEVQEGDVSVATEVTVLDFNPVQFNVTETPAGEANIALAKDQVGEGSASGQGLIWDGDAWIAQMLNFAEGLFVSTADASVENTTAKTAFAPSGVGSAIIAANSLVVGQVIEITCRGVLSAA